MNGDISLDQDTVDNKNSRTNDFIYQATTFEFSVYSNNQINIRNWVIVPIQAAIYT